MAGPKPKVGGSKYWVKDVALADNLIMSEGCYSHITPKFMKHPDEPVASRFRRRMDHPDSGLRPAQYLLLSWAISGSKIPF